MGKGLSPERKAKLEQLKEQMPGDAVPGFTVRTTSAVTPESPWVKRMSRYSKDLGVNAYAYFNYDIRKKGDPKRRRRKPRRIISAEGFQPGISISYAFPPPYAYMTPYNIRDVKHFVMHSFGHMWHAIKGPGTKNRWMNNFRKGRGVTPITQDDGSTIYIATGSDPESMANFQRFKNGLQACLHSAAQASAHFFIDRDGNLVVVGDCNDVMWTSQGVSMTSVGVEMEEAFYVTADTKEKKHRAQWCPGGNPPGTAGNIEYFTYSPQQMLTLSILIRKLETRYPQLKERNISFKPRSFKKTDAPGYTMHDWIKGSHHMDISPHFRTQALWNAFFELVDSHDHITKDMCFRSANYKASTKGDLIQADPTSTAPLNSATERLYNGAKEKIVAQDRSQMLATVKKTTVNDNAGKNATRAAQQVAQTVATTVEVAQRTQNPIVELPQDVTEVGDDGFLPGHDDMWSYS